MFYPQLIHESEQFLARHVQRMSFSNAPFLQGAALSDSTIAIVSLTMCQIASWITLMPISYSKQGEEFTYFFSFL